MTITLAKPERIDRVVFSNNRGLDNKTNFFRIPFVGEYRVEVSTDGTAWTEVAGSRDRRPMTPAWRRKRLLDLEMTAEERSRLAGAGDRTGTRQGAARGDPSAPVVVGRRVSQGAGPLHHLHRWRPPAQGRSGRRGQPVAARRGDPGLPSFRPTPPRPSGGWRWRGGWSRRRIR